MDLYYEFLQNFAIFILPFFAIDIVLFLLINPYLDRIISFMECFPSGIVINTHLNLLKVRKKNFTLGVFLSLICSFCLNLFFWTVFFFLCSILGLQLSTILTMFYTTFSIFCIISFFSILNFIKTID